MRNVTILRFSLEKWYETNQNEIVTLKLRYDFAVLVRKCNGTHKREIVTFKSVRYEPAFF